jgi:tetratricopeptide (TPR) repeat protein
MIGAKTDNSVEGSSGVTQVGGNLHGIPPETHKEMMQTALADLRKDLEGKHAEASRADQAELKMLQMQIDLLKSKISEQERRLANPEDSYREYLVRIAELEQLLENATVEIGDNRIKAATAELEAGNPELADEIFAEVEAHEAAAVARAAEAAFGRGLIAEGDIRWKDAAQFYAKAARLLPEMRTLSKAAEFAERSGDYQTALKYGQDYIEAAQRSGSDRDLATALNDQALNLHQTGRYDDAEPLYRQALEITERTLGPDHPDYATRLNNLAGLLQDTARYDAAEPLYRQALEIREKTLGLDHPDYAIRLNNLAELLRVTGRYDAAEPLYRQALEITEKTLGPDHPAYAIRLNNLALLLQATGRYDAAEPLHRQALEIGEKTLGADHPDYATDLNNLAVLYAYMKRFDAAEPLMAQAVQNTLAAFGAEHPDTISSQTSLDIIRKDMQ